MGDRIYRAASFDQAVAIIPRYEPIVEAADLLGEGESMSAAVIALATGWALAALASGLVYRLMIDRGRLLLQIERLEQRILATNADALVRNRFTIGALAADDTLPVHVRPPVDVMASR